MKTNPLAGTLQHDALDQLPLGVLLLDTAGHIQGWNAWMAEKTTISERDAVGKTLRELFPGFEHPRFQQALEEVFTSGSPQLLSHTLNRRVIPIKSEFSSQHGLEWMQQKVQISALTLQGGGQLALVSILDVTENTVQAQALTDAARSLQESSSRDALTGLHNRRFMLSWLEQGLKIAQRHGYSIACLMLDIDHFKHINDTYGHHTGDLVLQGFARVVEGLVRDSDIFVRYGGEEFVVLLPHCTLEMATIRAQAMVDALHQAALGPLDPGQVTCSIGVASTHVDSPDTYENLLREADQQLYVAKNAGRDSVSAPLI